MSDLTIRSAADYVRTSKAPAAFMAFLQLVRRVYTFTQERANRLTRYIVITRAYKAGKPVRDIENKYGCSRGTVLRYARLAELPKRPKHFPAEIRAGVIKDYKAKMAVADIAKLHDVSPAYVSKVAREEGISRYEPRPKTRRRF
jgi:hypothetical protein